MRFTMTRNLLIYSFLGLVSLLAGPVQAAKAPQVDICHFDADKGIFKPIAISGNAVQKHLDNHGDQLPNVDPGSGAPILDEDCLVVIAPPAVLARAYIDVDKNENYDGNVDIEIAELVDTHRNGEPSVGDTVQLGQYPTSFDPCLATSCSDIGSWNPTPLPVTAVENDTPGQRVDVRSASGTLYRWNVEGVEFERLFIDSSSVGAGSTIISDYRFGASDLLAVPDGGEPDPSDPVVPTLFQVSTQDDYFLNIEFPAP